MVRLCCFSWFLTIVLAFFGEFACAATDVVIREYPARRNELTGKVELWGHKIVHSDFDVQLEEVIMKVPIMSIQYEGLHHVRGEGVSIVEARAKCIAERLTVAWQLLDKGGRLRIRNDDWNDWRVKSKNKPPKYPAIYVVSSVLDEKPLRIMTVYPEDARAFPGVSESPRELAKYIVALIEAHYLLFQRKSSNLADYEGLQLDKTREGKIFKEIFIRAQEVMELKNLEQLDADILKDALARIAMPQRDRLVRLTFKAPPDWIELQKQQ